MSVFLGVLQNYMDAVNGATRMTQRRATELARNILTQAGMEPAADMVHELSEQLIAAQEAQYVMVREMIQSEVSLTMERFGFAAQALGMPGGATSTNKAAEPTPVQEAPKPTTKAKAEPAEVPAEAEPARLQAVPSPEPTRTTEPAKEPEPAQAAEPVKVAETPAKKTVAKKAPAKKTTATKAPAKKAPAKKAPVKRATKTTTAKKTAAPKADDGTTQS